MLRKGLLIIIGLVFILGSYLLFYNSNNAYLIQTAEQQYNFEDKFKVINIPDFIDSDDKYKEVLSVLNDASKEVNINYMKVQLLSGYQIDKAGFYNYGLPRTELNYQVHTVKPSNIWILFQQSTKKVGSKYVNDLPLKGYSSGISAIDNDISYNGRQGDFYIEADSKDDYDKFIETLALKYNREFHKNYTLSSFQKSKDYQKANLQIEFPDLTDLQFALFGLLSIFVLLYVLLSSKYIGSYKLEGLSNLMMTRELFRTVFLFMLIITGFVITYLLAFEHWHIQLTAYIVLGSIIVILILTALGAVFSLNYLSLNSQLKNKNYLSWSFYIVYIIKAIILIMVFSNLVPIFQLVSTEAQPRVFTSYKNKKIGSEYGIIGPKVVGYDNDNEVGKLISLEQLDDLMYEKLNRRGALLFDGGDFEADKVYTDRKDHDYQKFNIVNPNYLKRFPIKDVDDRTIKVNDDESTLVLLMPKNKKSELTALKKYISDTELQITGKRPVLKVISVPANRTYFDLSMGDVRVMQPMVVSTTNNSSYVCRNIMNGQENRDALKMPIDISERETYKSILKDLEDSNYEDNYAQIVKLNNLDTDNLKNGIGNIKKTVVSLMVTIVFIILITVYLVVLYFRSNDKEIYYKYMSGYSDLRIISKLMLLIIMQYVILLIMLLAKGDFDGVSLVGLFMLFSFELMCVLVSAVVIKHKVLKENK
ncbi:hypothetical protein LIX87_01425 [Weissella viridescens]|uniref:hypothetical protein n=1 Tax=Weissella viridescens TaxID=1629 RepID=UPI001D062CBD|nr:hypothetical protein [Weissella viridescens]MCB6839677.1 hypothetical protein [Weissella viridescens]MCB6846409.1 hypothetical protein [Weissella viridescens]